MVKNNLPITTANLEVVARIKTECRKHRIPLEVGLNYYLEIANIQQSKVTGKQLYEYLQKLTIAHRTTIIRWFDCGFNPDKIYSPSDLSKILLHALMYILRKKNNDSQQKSNRSGALSSEKIKSELH